jgi:ribosome biogenesis protein Nip4
MCTGIQESYTCPVFKRGSKEKILQSTSYLSRISIIRWHWETGCTEAKFVFGRL